MNRFLKFVELVIPLFLITSGLIGNLLGLVIVTRNKKLSSRIMYRYLFVIDSIKLVQLVNIFMGRSFGDDLTRISGFLCKLISYFSLLIGSLSPWLLLYISTEKLMSIKFPNKRIDLRKTIFKKIYLAVVLLVNSLYYLFFSFNYDIQQISVLSTNQTVCLIFKLNATFNIIDLINRFVMPSFIMLGLTLFLVKCIVYKPQKRIWNNFSQQQNKAFKRDIKLASTSIALNLIFILLNLPFIFYLFNVFEFYFDLMFSFTQLLYYLTFAVKFYIILFMNPWFRRDLFSLLKLKKAPSKVKPCQ